MTLPLVERFRPARLADIRGQPNAVKLLSAKLKARHSFAAILHGDAGVGKTSAAYAIAAELGCDVNGSEAQRLSTGFWIVPSGSQSIERIREIFEHCRYRPMTGSLWWVICFNEADVQSAQAKKFWCDQLELLPTKTIVIFTTNDFAAFPEPVQERCLCIRFESKADKLWQDAQELVNHVWHTSLGRDHAPTLEEMGFTRSGRLSFRQVVKAIEPLILAELPDEPQAISESEPAQANPQPVEATDMHLTEQKLRALLADNPNLAHGNEHLAKYLPAKPLDVAALAEPEPPRWHPVVGDQVRTRFRFGRENKMVTGTIRAVNDEGLYLVSGFWFRPSEMQQVKEEVAA